MVAVSTRFSRGRGPSLALGAMGLLSACVAPTTVPQIVAPRPPAYSVLGLENVMGRTARELEAGFGRPDLDVQEGQARKLQFSSGVCVLDAYLYARERGKEAVVTHLDARLPDGRDVDRASCVAALSRRTGAR